MKYVLAVLVLCICAVASTPGKTVTLTWNASPSSGVTYNVYRSVVTGSCFTTKIASGITPLTYADSTVVAGTTYFYSVSAQNSGGESISCSNEVQIAVPTPPSPPTNLQGTAN